MTHISPMPSPIPFAPMPRRSGWRFFPLAVALGLLIVVVVNGVFVWISLSTFPGVAVQNSFEHSNNYDQAITAAERQAELGWTVRAEVAAAAPEILIVDRSGEPLQGAHIAAVAKRPLGPDQAQSLAFVNAGRPGRYIADAVTLESGQWDLLVTVTVGTDEMHVTRRILVK